MSLQQVFPDRKQAEGRKPVILATLVWYKEELRSQGFKKKHNFNICQKSNMTEWTLSMELLEYENILIIPHGDRKEILRKLYMPVYILYINMSPCECIYMYISSIYYRSLYVVYLLSTW